MDVDMVRISFITFRLLEGGQLSQSEPLTGGYIRKL